MDIDDPWDLSTGFSEVRPRARKVARYLGFGLPVRLTIPEIPLVARAILLHALLAIAIPVSLLFGLALYSHSWFPQLLVVSAPLTFSLALAIYALKMKRRNELRKKAPEIADRELSATPPSFVWSVALPTVATPLFLLAVPTISLWFENRLIAAVSCAAAAYAAFAIFGHLPIQFFREYLLSPPLASRADRLRPFTGASQPDLKLLAIILLVVCLGPIYFSTAVTILGLSVGLTIYLFRSLVAVRPNDNPLKLLAYTCTRLHALGEEYIHYDDVPEEVKTRWVPPATKAERNIAYFAIMSALYSMLLVSLNFYCPWEPFAAWFTSTPNEPV
jgi:hypothetical protein